MAAALRCYHLTALLQPGDDHPDARRRIARELNALADNLPATAAADIQTLVVPRDSDNSAILQEIAEVLARLARGEAVPLPRGEVEKAPLLLPDAWSNPAYLHFALKTLLATLLCYVFYTAADWQGIHTIMLSCVIVAQPGLGATMQKTWLRIGGALLATLIALLLIVFVQPWTDSLSGLLAMPSRWEPTPTRGRKPKTGRRGRVFVRQKRSCASVKAIACTRRRGIPF